LRVSNITVVGLEQAASTSPLYHLLCEAVADTGNQ
jgi:hypothetical protein